MAKSIVDLVFRLKGKCERMEESFFHDAAISPADYEVINSLDPDERITASEFAERLDVSVSRASRIITRMLHSGYLKTATATDDRRKLMISLSDQGLNVKNHIIAMKEECNQRIREKLNGKQLGSIESELKAIIDAL